MKNLCFTTLLVVLGLTLTAQQTAGDYFAPLKYRNIGPFRGGRSVTATGVANNPMTYYMGTTGGGLWKTTNAGHHWENVSDGYFKTGSVGAVAVSRSHPNVVYVGMGEHAPRAVMTSHGDGIYKSTDGGKTWKHLGLRETQHVSRIIVHPENPDVAYVAAQGQLYGPNPERGVYKTTDGGKTWSKTLFVNNLTGASELSMDHSDPNVLYAAMWEHQRKPWQVVSGGEGSGLYKSTDAGETWEELTAGLPEEKGKLAIAVCQSNTQKVYALVESDTYAEKGGLFVSGDAGATWSRVSGDHRLVQRAWYYLEVFADPTDENTVYVLSAPALRSTDGGKSWETLSGTHGDYHDLWINPENARNLCIANDGGAAISFDYGETWSTQDNMPTAQFYRINTDNQFPYRIYGGQQDNTSVSIAHRELGSSTIGTDSWKASAGGESAFLAFDPDNPRYVMGGNYLGTIEVIDNEAGSSTNIMAAPIQYLGRDARDMKYRFNWNAPIIWSKHEPGTFYHASQHLLRTRDRGQTWEEASPDLTRNDDSKQGKGGVPYTNEAVGAENYGTISYVVEAPDEAGTMWVGTDDGYVQLTRDYGKSWNNVTPSSLEECLVNAIEVSPHDPGTAYIATTRYKFNDHTPKLMKTVNYGKSWTDITGNIPAGAYTRVVREDTEQENLLFAGTETGLYLSRDGGGNWESFNLNLPLTPITDLKVAHDDLIVATSGRSFWVLDDLETLRQYAPGNQQTKLYQPAPTVVADGGSALNGNDSDGTNPLEGVNPASGVVIYYELPIAMDSTEISLTITDADGEVVRRLDNQKSDYTPYPGGPPSGTKIPAKSGLNRLVWDLRYPHMSGITGAYIEGNYRGRKVGPGTYTITLEAGGKTLSTECEVLPNPNYDLTAADYTAYNEFMQAAEGKLNAMHGLTNELMHLRTRLQTLTEKMDAKKQAALIEEAKAIEDQLRTWDELMVQRLSKAYDDVENYPNKFTANYMFALNHAASGLPRVNIPTRERIAELNGRWQELKGEGLKLRNEVVPSFEKKLWAVGIGALWLGE